MKHRIIAAIIFVLAFNVGSIFASSPVSAHVILDSSSPSSSSVLAESPQEIRLDFNEEVESTFANVRLFDANQREVSIGKTVRSMSDDSIVTSQLPPLTDGLYVSVWRVVSADGHPATGSFSFEVGDKSSESPVELMRNVLTGIDNTSDLSYPMAVLRFLALFGVISLVGAMSVNWRTTPFSEPRLFRLAILSTTAIAIGSLGALFLQGPVATGKSWSAIFDTDALANVLPTRLGIAILIRLAVVVVWGGLLLSVVRTHSRLWRTVAVLGSAVLIATYSFSGHPSAASSSLIYVLVDVAHLTATSLWAGTLIALAVVNKSEKSDEYLLTFSRIATYAMPITVLTGVVQGLHLVGGLDRLNDTNYGKLLVSKFLLVVTVIALATYIRCRLIKKGTVNVGRAVQFEAVIVVVILCITSVLLGKSPVSSNNFDELTFSATLVQSEVVGDFSIVPTKVGAAEVHTIFSPPGGALSPVTKVVVTLLLPEKNIPAIPVTMSPVGPNHWIGVVQFPDAGQWEMQVRASAIDNQTLLFTAKVDVAS